MTEAERIARGLTEAQRKRLDGVAELRALGLSWASRHGSLSIRTSRATTSALFALGLLADDYGECLLTPLGIAVRAVLEVSRGQEVER